MDSEISKIMEKLMEITYDLNFKMNLRVNAKIPDLHDKVAAFELGPLHIAVLAIISRESKEPMLSFVADKLCVSYATMTNLADKLEKMGFIERKKDKSDRRAIRLAVTKNAAKFMEDVKNHHAEGLKTYLDLLSEADKKKMLESFNVIYNIVMKNRSKDETSN